MMTCSRCGAQMSGNAKFCPVCGAANTVQEVGVLPVGTILRGRYRIEKTLGKGGFGITYKAFDGRENAKVAIKEYYPNGMAHRDTGSTQVFVSDHTQTDSFRSGADKFYDEAKTIARFNGNPNIVGVRDFFNENGTAYFVMEYLDGVDLKHYIKQRGGTIPQENVLHIAKAMSDALLITHSMNVLHRDISPDNIYVLNDGNIKLIDFGAARQVMNEQSQSMSVILKQGFAPLEQYQRKGKQGPWTDIYALGATLYYALTGKVPDDITERLDNPDLGKAQDYKVDEDFWKVIEKCMAVKMDDRYQSIVDFKADLNKLSVHDESLEKPQTSENTADAAADVAKLQSGGDETMAQSFVSQYGTSGQQYGTSGQQYGTSGQQYGTSGQPYGTSGQPYGMSGQQSYGQSMQMGYSGYGVPKKKNNKLVVGIISAVLAVAAAVVLIVVLVSNGYKGTAKKFLKAFCDGNGKKAAKYCIEPVREDIDSWTGYGGVKFSYSIGESQELSREEIEEIQYDLGNMYNYYEEIKKAYNVYFTMTVAAGEERQSSTGTILMIKVGGKWRVADVYI